jgi:hypothetical protein
MGTIVLCQAKSVERGLAVPTAAYKAALHKVAFHFAPQEDSSPNLFYNKCGI